MLKRILTITGLLILTAAVAGLWWFSKEGMVRIVNGNKLTVSTDETLSSDKVKIKFGVSINSINRQNDLELFDNPNKYTVLYEGSNDSRPKTEFGENDFLITYDNAYYLSFRHFIRTDFKSDFPPDHKYHFSFFTKNNKPTVRVRIDGEEKMDFERPLIDKRLAAKYRCNVPVDSAGDMFNMVELVPDKK
jgi:hypothetical protein